MKFSVLKFALVTLVLLSSTEFAFPQVGRISPPEFDGHGLNSLKYRVLRLTYQGSAVSNFTDVIPEFHVRKIGSSEFTQLNSYQEPAKDVEGDYDYYTIYWLEPGEYEALIDVNANSDNPPRYPGDFYASYSFTNLMDIPVMLDMNMMEIIHLTSPSNNNDVLPEQGKNCEDLPMHDAMSNFEWNDIGESIRYLYEIVLVSCLTGKDVEIVRKHFQNEAFLNPILPKNKKGYFYAFRLTAHDNFRQVGQLIVNQGPTQYSTEYQFHHTGTFVIDTEPLDPG